MSKYASGDQIEHSSVNRIVLFFFSIITSINCGCSSVARFWVSIVQGHCSEGQSQGHFSRWRHLANGKSYDHGVFFIGFPVADLELRSRRLRQSIPRGRFTYLRKSLERVTSRQHGVMLYLAPHVERGDCLNAAKSIRLCTKILPGSAHFLWRHILETFSEIGNSYTASHVVTSDLTLTLTFKVKPRSNVNFAAKVTGNGPQTAQRLRTRRVSR